MVICWSNAVCSVIYAMKALGYPEDRIKTAAVRLKNELNSSGFFDSSDYYIHTACIGSIIATLEALGFEPGSIDAIVSEIRRCDGRFDIQTLTETLQEYCGGRL